MHLMTIRARQLPEQPGRLPSYFRIRPGEPCDLTFRISDNDRDRPVDWSGQGPRFRIYSQYVDSQVVVEVTDPARCSFGADGTWRLRLTADETQGMPRGGMCFTLEHRSPRGDYQLGVRGGISCCDDSMNRLSFHQFNPELS